MTWREEGVGKITWFKDGKETDNRDEADEAHVKYPANATDMAIYVRGENIEHRASEISRALLRAVEVGRQIQRREMRKVLGL